jgi:hypothetical protein
MSKQSSIRRMIMLSADLAKKRMSGRWIGMVIVTLALVVLMVFAVTAFAQPSPQSGKALTGTWRVVVNPINCATGAPLPSFVSMNTFAHDGTMTDTNASPAFQPGQRSPGHGVWEFTGRNSYRAVSEAYILFTSEPNPPVPGFSRGLQRITQTIQVTQNQFTSEASAEFFDGDGNLVITLCVTATGQRMSLDN